jgi:hypothetical protein
MSKTRLDLQTFLETLKGDRKVYFQPPASKKMDYPAIVYKLSNINNTHADNLPYLQGTAYQVCYITKNPDDIMIKTLSKLPLCTFDRHFVTDNLNHYFYTLYY